MNLLDNQKFAERRLNEVQQLLDANTGGERKAKSQATVIVDLCSDLDLFHDGETAYTAIVINGRRQTYGLKSKFVREFLAHRYRKNTRTVPSNQAVENALCVLGGMAMEDGVQRSVHTRIAERDGHIYIDLGDPEWRVIDVDANGWNVIDTSPVYFVRRPGISNLPIPVKGATVNELRQFLNVSGDSDFRRLVGWLVQALRPCGPYPVLVLNGEQGSAKSTAARLLRSLVDPNKVPIRALPRSEDDFIIAAQNGWILSYDNLSGIPDWFSDAVCRVSTGGGIAKRQLYSDDDEILINVTRPVCLNGIEAIAVRGDLADRAIIVNLDAIPDTQRMTEAQLSKGFSAAAPGILGALLDAVSCALGRVENVVLDEKPRLADHAIWLEAASPALGWLPGQYVGENIQARNSMIAQVAEGSPFASAVMFLLDRVDDWKGTATDLLSELSNQTEPQFRKSPGWPTSPVGVGSALNRFAPSLRTLGYSVERTPGHGSGRTIILKRLATAKGSTALAIGSESRKEDRRTGQDSVLHTNPPKRRKVTL